MLFAKLKGGLISLTGPVIAKISVKGETLFLKIICQHIEAELRENSSTHTTSKWNCLPVSYWKCTIRRYFNFTIFFSFLLKAIISIARNNMRNTNSFKHFINFPFHVNITRSTSGLEFTIPGLKVA